MVRSRESRVTPVIRCDHEHIVLTHLRKELIQPPVKRVQCIRITLYIIPVAVQHVKIHQVHKTQSVKILLQKRERHIHVLLIPLIGKCPCQSPSRKNFVDLSHSDDVFSRRLHHVKDRVPGRFQGEVMAVHGPGKIRSFPDIGPRDHTPHCVVPGEHRSGSAAALIQFLERDHLLMRRDLEHTVRRSVDDPLSGPHLLLSVFSDHLCSGAHFIADHAAPRLLRELIEQLLRKSLRISGHRLW